MATMVENTIMYDAGVHLKRDSPYWEDDRNDKIKFFRNIVGAESEKEKAEMSELLESRQHTGSPVGIDDHLPPPFLENKSEFPTASAMFEDMTRCIPKKADTKDISGSIPEAYDPATKNAETYEEISRTETETETEDESETSDEFEKYRDIEVYRSTDDLGRTYYLLDYAEQSMRIVVFSIQDVDMVCINEVLMSMEYFLSISQAKSIMDLSGAQHPIVNLRFGNEFLNLQKCSVPMLLMALTVCDRHQKGLSTEKKEDTDWAFVTIVCILIVLLASVGRIVLM
jgi:hypothetical protein